MRHLKVSKHKFIGPEMKCTKKQFTDKAEAIVWHQVRFDVPFRVYQCPHCRFWHITTSNISKKTLEEMADIIRNGRATFVKRISNHKSLFIVEHYIGKFLVLYHRRGSSVELIKELTD